MTKEGTSKVQQKKVSKQLLESGCQSSINKTAIFQKPNFESWFDPSNWILESIQDEKIKGSQQSRLSGSLNKPSPVPHLQQVPCRYDKAIFPSNAAYKVYIIFDLS